MFFEGNLFVLMDVQTRHKQITRCEQLKMIMTRVYSLKNRFVYVTNSVLEKKKRNIISFRKIILPYVKK